MSEHDREAFVSLAIVVGSAIGGGIFAVVVAVFVMLLVPRELQPSCGHTIIDPAAILGALLGFFGGVVIAARRP